MFLVILTAPTSFSTPQKMAASLVSMTGILDQPENHRFLDYVTNHCSDSDGLIPNGDASEPIGTMDHDGSISPVCCNFHGDLLEKHTSFPTALWTCFYRNCGMLWRYFGKIEDFSQPLQRIQNFYNLIRQNSKKILQPTGSV